MSELTVQYQEETTPTEQLARPAASYTQFNRLAYRNPELDASLKAALEDSEYQMALLKHRLHIVDVDLAVAKALVYVDESERQTRIFYYTIYMRDLNRQKSLYTEYRSLLQELLESKTRTELQQASLLSKKVRMELHISEQAHHLKQTYNKVISAGGLEMILPTFGLRLNNRTLVRAYEKEKEREKRRIRPGY